MKPSAIIDGLNEVEQTIIALCKWVNKEISKYDETMSHKLPYMIRSLVKLVAAID